MLGVGLELVRDVRASALGGGALVQLHFAVAMLAAKLGVAVEEGVGDGFTFQKAHSRRRRVHAGVSLHIHKSFLRRTTALVAMGPFLCGSESVEEGTASSLLPYSPVVRICGEMVYRPVPPTVMRSSLTVGMPTPTGTLWPGFAAGADAFVEGEVVADHARRTSALRGRCRSALRL